MRRSPGPGARRTVPLRKSLFARLLAVSALVAACSVAATAWLAVQTTSGAIRQEQGQNLAADARIYHRLLGYAAAHPTWDGVGATVRELAEQSGRRIALTTQARAPLADSAARDAAALPAQASAVVDPLSVDTALSTGAGATGSTTTDRVDPRAVGPFRLPEAERTRLRKTADRGVACLGDFGIAADVVAGASGRPLIQVVGGNDPERIRGTGCAVDALDTPTATERKALKALNQLADACLERQGRDGVHLSLGLSWGQAAEPVPAEAVPVPAAPMATMPPTAEPSAVPTEAPRAEPR
ncbi:two-component sensor histidine kinase, partial [Streptomyces drozdowiczii]|nr:two-component sensor histidine kinase [Streptomyces drozdowiczii]